MKNTDQLKDMADEMGITLYQRFSESEAARFLNISPEALTLLSGQSKISYLKIPNEPVEYFGIHLIEFLMGSEKPVTKSTPSKPERILRIREVTEMTGISRTTIWRREVEGSFPQRVSLGKSSVGWKASEIERWVESRESV